MRILIPYFPNVFLSWSGILSVIASFTMIYGALMALVQTDFKRILAYSSVNQMGYMLLGLASGTYIGTFGALIHIITHGVAKAALFLASGALIHYAGTKDVRLLGGLAQKMPITAIVIIISGLSIAGAPP
jgi:formate hydrogenlyase subunit 3/multisubunit Na+/H+ antiporter MnhD subunit